MEFGVKGLYYKMSKFYVKDFSFLLMSAHKRDKIKKLLILLQCGLVLKTSGKLIVQRMEKTVRMKCVQYSSSNYT